jgi:hypothetical protein
MGQEELLQRIAMLRDDYAERGEPSRSGYIDPSEADLARDDGARDAFREAAASLASLIAEVRSTA